MSQYDFIAADRKLNPFVVGVEENGRMIMIQNENDMLGIFEDEPSSYTEPFTDLPIIMSVQLGNFDYVKAALFDYVKTAVKDNNVIEIWSTWMEEVDDIEKKTVHENELSIDCLEWVLGHKNWDHPRCLKIYKWTRGKK